MSALFGLIRVSPIIFPDVGEPSGTYDCDDETLDMYLHFEKLGIRSVPIVGNLETNNETYSQSNHVWLLVSLGGWQIAYDWGTPRFDKQHYEGYKISLDYLIYVVRQDFKNPDLLPIAED